MHLDLPPIPLSAPLVMLRKIIWVLIYLIAPEAMSFTALMQFVYARDLVKECKVIGYNISMMQAFYIRGRGSAVRNLHQFSNSNVPLNRDGFDHEDSLWYHSPKAFPETDFTSIVVGAESVPSTKYLKEMSKADALVKLVTSAQALWTLAQIVARAFQRLSISLLEYATIAYIILAAVSYGLWWKKPYDISHRYVVEADQATQSGKHLVNLDEWDAISNGSHWAGVETEKSSDSPFMMALHNDLPDSFDLAYDSTLLVFCAILGGIHCLAWNYGFASLQEAWLWRACAIMAIILPFWFLVQAPVEKMLSPSIIDNSIIALYVLVRVYMIVECFLSFRDAPSSIYQQVDWSVYIPHVA